MGRGRNAAQPAGRALARRIPPLARRCAQGRGRLPARRAAHRHDLGRGAGMSEADWTRSVASFLAFTALLRRAGFAVAPEQTMAWLAGIELLGPREMNDIRRAAHATLGIAPERRAEFDALFDAHFLGLTGTETISEPSDEVPLQAGDEGAGPDPL